MTLGKINPVPDVGTTPKGVPLYDRYLDSAFSAQLPQRSPLLNIAEFNRIMRICNEVDTVADGDPAVTTPATDHGVLSDQLAIKMTTYQSNPLINLALANTQCPEDAGIHFDFRTPPWVYSTQTDIGETAAPPPTPKTGDIRAMRLLDCLAFVDRVSDYSIDIGDNNPIARGLSKLRIPGQINVNTASAEVLATLAPLNNAANYKYIGEIMAYRWRTVHNDPRIPVPVQGTHDYNDATAFPGYGIRSLGELNVPLTMDTVPVTPDPNRAYTLDERDGGWASLYNMCTVRSDTFIVYGYLEAVKANPNYVSGANTHNNGTDWYGPAVDDARGNTTAQNIRVARRRWVALVDRSMSNYNRLGPSGDPAFPLNSKYVGPRVVVVKELPN
jgi:hypothetical protein